MFIFNKLPPKIQDIIRNNREKIAYLFIGCCTTLVSIVSKLILFAIIPNDMAIKSTLAVVLSWIISVEFAFITNKKIVFQKETKTKKEYFKLMLSFFSARLLTLGMEETIFLIFVDMMDFNTTIITFASQVFIFIANYIISKLFVFNK